jgi:hypothetical protein
MNTGLRPGFSNQWNVPQVSRLSCPENRLRPDGQHGKRGPAPWPARNHARKTYRNARVQAWWVKVPKERKDEAEARQPALAYPSTERAPGLSGFPLGNAGRSGVSSVTIIIRARVAISGL